MSIWDKILGKKKEKEQKKIPLPEDLEAYLRNQVTLCNNQLRGVSPEKAKEYNKETIEFYIADVFETGFYFGIEHERQEQINKQASPDN